MRILITGISGLLGYDIYRILSTRTEVYGISKDNCPEYLPVLFSRRIDLTDFNLTYDTITAINPDIVIHTVAYTDVDGCEENPDYAYKINVLTTRNVACACQRFDTALVYISTDYVFDGQQCPLEGYDEMATPNPISVYGKTKLAGEYYVSHLLNRFYIIRTSWLFGARRKTFVEYVINSVREKKEIRVVDDQVGNPTYTYDLAQAIEKLIFNSRQTGCYGIYHLTNSTACTRFEQAQEILRLSDLPINSLLVPGKAADIYRIARRPVNTKLNNLTWRVQGNVPLRSWRDALAEYLVEKGG